MYVGNDALKAVVGGAGEPAGSSAHQGSPLGPVRDSGSRVTKQRHNRGHVIQSGPYQGLTGKQKRARKLERRVQAEVERRVGSAPAGSSGDSQLISGPSPGAIPEIEGHALMSGGLGSPAAENHPDPSANPAMGQALTRENAPPAEGQALLGVNNEGETATMMDDDLDNIVIPDSPIQPEPVSGPISPVRRGGDGNEPYKPPFKLGGWKKDGK